ncbi:MAG: discoidin domain-containing protein [Candidatus Binatia bacterium]
MALVVLVGAGSASAQQMVLDDFKDLSGWSAIASEDSKVWMVQEPGRTGNAMRIGFDLNAGGGYVIVRKAFSLPLPANYAFTFYLRGDAPQNNFEFKIVDPSGKNVWWRKQRDFNFPTEWQPVTIRKSRLAFAWGPSGGRELDRVGAIEFAISSGTGGKGSIWIEDLEFEEREPSSHNGHTPSVSASTSMAGHEPALMLDLDPGSTWKSERLPDNQWVLIDLLRNVEYGGLVIDWDPDDYATAYQVQVSNDGTHWTNAYGTTSGNGGRDYIYMPDAESRYIRLDLQRSSRGQGYGIASVALKPVDFSASPNQFFTAIAQDEPMGLYPKYFYGKQTYWTVVGVSGDGKQGLLNEEGMLEVDKGAFSIEPFLSVGGKLITWNSVHTVQELEEGFLPIPSVTWEHETVNLTITAFASGKPGKSTLYASYRVDNHGDTSQRVQLFLAIRPFQVNPPWQSLNMTGGVAPIREIRFDGRAVWVGRDKAVISLPAPDRFGAASFEHGAITDFLRKNTLPPQLHVSDPFGFASGALQYSFDLKPGGHEKVDLAVPFHEPYVAAAIGLGSGDGRPFIDAQREETRRFWQTILGRVDIQLPPEAENIVRTLKTTLAYILINRNGPALQPGSRDYARAWIRDGALTSVALLEMGCTQEVRDFIRWYAQYQSVGGKIPCCVDRRGPDPALEHDSAGEFIYAIAEYYRHTHDVGFAHDTWPQVVRAVDYLSSLRQKRMTAAFRTPEKEAYYGLLPESLSHEGYSSYPVHSYWDDFFALRGFKDAAAMAIVMGDEERAASFADLRDDFRRSLRTSISKAMALHGIDYIPGSVELGDFDPTSTAIALTVGLEVPDLPEDALRRTFDLYDVDADKRIHGEVDWDAYAPYELRNVDAFVRLGQRERAREILNLMLFDQRPAAWNQWAEVVWRDSSAPNFIGDMPHTWVGSTFIQSVRTLFAYERESDRALVVAAGLPSEWVLSKSGVAVKRLPTHYGVLSYSLRGEGANAMLLRLSGDLTLPPGNIVLRPPLLQPLKAVTVNGKPIETFTADSATVSEFPAEVLLEY